MSKFKNINYLFTLLVITLSLSVLKVKADVSDKTPLILISIDGFRYDYIEKYQPPALLSIIKNGVRAESMQPVYPSKTFPNHLSIITGMYPSHHGIIHNSFYSPAIDDVYRMGKAFDNPKWIQGTPLWVHAERNGVKSASYFWPESDSKLEGISASYSYKYNKKTPYETRINQIIEWLKLPKNERPKFIMAYFSAVDDAGHQFGPDSKEVEKAVLNVDKHIGNLRDTIKNKLKMKVNLVVVSDHGMIDISNGKKIDWKGISKFSDYRVIDSTTQILLYPNKSKSKKELENFVNQINKKSNGQYVAFLKDNLPTNTHYFNNNRIPEIIIDATSPNIFYDRDRADYPKGMHGYDPELVPEMGALFIAEGPNFKKGLKIKPFKNIHVFPLLNGLLDLPLPDNLDGKSEVLESIVNN